MGLAERLKRFFRLHLPKRASIKEGRIVNRDGVPVEDTDEGRLFLRIAGGQCPSCGSTKGFIEGPAGGLSVNIFCSNCGQGYNVTPMISIAVMIHKDERYIQGNF